MSIRAPVPNSADIRREARKRLVIGLSGLILMLMLVVLAGLVTGQARKEAELAKAQAQAAGVINPGTAAASGATEPLADLGVAPALEAPGPDPMTAGAGSDTPADPAGRVTVPDLQPDPRLKTSQPKQ